MESIFLLPTSDRKTATLTNIKSRKVIDILNMQNKPIIYPVDLLAPILTNIFNLSLSTNKFPIKMKVAKVSLLQKHVTLITSTTTNPS